MDFAGEVELMPVPEIAPAYTRRHWAKSDRRQPGRIHLLEHHLADVGACFEALLQATTSATSPSRAPWGPTAGGWKWRSVGSTWKKFTSSTGASRPPPDPFADF